MQKIYNVFVSKPCTLKIQTSKYITKKPHQSILPKKTTKTRIREYLERLPNKYLDMY